MRRHLQDSPLAIPIVDPTVEDGAEEDQESDAYEVEISSYGKRAIGTGSGKASGVPVASSLPKHLSLPRGHTSPYGTPNERGNALRKEAPPSPLGAKTSGVSSRSLSSSNFHQQQQQQQGQLLVSNNQPTRGLSGSSNLSSHVSGNEDSRGNGRAAGKKKSGSEISFFNSRRMKDERQAASQAPVSGVEEGEGGTFRQESRPMDHLEATGHLKHAIISLAQLFFIANAAEDEDQEVHRTVSSMNRLRRYPNAIDFFGGALDDEDDDIQEGESFNGDDEKQRRSPKMLGLKAWASVEDFPDDDGDIDDDGTASILSSSRGDENRARRRRGWRRHYGLHNLHEISARAARSLKMSMWMLLPFVPAVSLFGVFALPAATALSGWSTLILVGLCFLVVIVFSVRRLCCMCIQRISWPLSPMEIDETGQLAAEQLQQQQQQRSPSSPLSPPTASSPLPAVHSYVFVTKSLLDLADAAAGIPFRLFTALLVILYNIAAAVLALSVGLPLVGGGYNSAHILSSLDSEARLFSNAADKIPVEGCRFDIRAHIVPTSGLFLLFLLIASPTPLRRLQYWSTHAFRLLTVVIVVVTCLWTAVVPLLVSGESTRDPGYQANISASLSFINADREWFPIDIELGTGERQDGFQIPPSASYSGSAFSFVMKRLGVSLALVMWLFVGALYAVRCSGHHIFGAELLRAQYKQLHEVRQRIQDAMAASASLNLRPSQLHRDEEGSPSQLLQRENTRKRLLLAADETKNMRPPSTSFFTRYLALSLALITISLTATCVIGSSKYALDAHVFQGPLALLWTAKLNHDSQEGTYRCTLGLQDGLHVRSLRVSAVLCFLLGGVLMLWVPFFISEASRRIVFHRRPTTTAEDDNATAKRFLQSKKRRADEEARDAQNSDVLLSNTSVTSASENGSSATVTKVRILSHRAMKRWNIGRVWRSFKSACRSAISCCSYWGGVWRCCDRTSRRGAAPADDVATEFDGTKVSVLDIFERLRKRGANRRRSQLLAFIAEFLLIRVVLLIICVFCAVVTLSGERVRCISFWSFWNPAPYVPISPNSIDTLVFKSCDEALTPLTVELFVRITLTMAMTGGIIVGPLLLLIPMVILLREAWLKWVAVDQQEKLLDLAKALRFWRSPKLYGSGVGGETPPAREYSTSGFIASHNTVSMSRFGGARGNSHLQQYEQRLMSGSERPEPQQYGSVLGGSSGNHKSTGPAATAAASDVLSLAVLVAFAVVSCALLLVCVAGGIHATATFLSLSRHHILSD